MKIERPLAIHSLLPSRGWNFMLECRIMIGVRHRHILLKQHLPQHFSLKLEPCIWKVIGICRS